MPGPVLIASSGSWHLNVRVPADLRDKVRGRQVTLPIAGRDVGKRSLTGALRG